MTAPFNTIIYDAKFVQLILTNTVEKSRLAKNQIAAKQMALVKGKIHKQKEIILRAKDNLFFPAWFSVRVGNNAKRAIRFVDHVARAVGVAAKKSNGPV